MTHEPEPGRPILAELRRIHDLGEARWFEVVCFDSGAWHSYAGSDTFDRAGDEVVRWRYVTDALGIERNADAPFDWNTPEPRFSPPTAAERILVALDQMERRFVNAEKEVHEELERNRLEHHKRIRAMHEEFQKRQRERSGSIATSSGAAMAIREARHAFLREMQPDPFDP